MDEYDKHLRSPEWAAIRAEALEKAGYQCQRCGAKASLEVHHLHYDTLGNESLDDLEVVCSDCHPDADEERAEQTKERLEERQEERWERRLDAWAESWYGRDWRRTHNAEDIERQFVEWLDERCEGDDIPEHRRPIPLWHSKTAALNTPEASPAAVPVFAEEKRSPTAIPLSAFADLEQCAFKFFKNYVEAPQELPPYQSMSVHFARFMREVICELLEPFAAQQTQIPANLRLEYGEVVRQFDEALMPGRKPLPSIRMIKTERPHTYHDKIKDIVDNFNLLLKRRLVQHHVVSGHRVVEVTRDGSSVRTSVDLVTQAPDGKWYIWMWKTGKVRRSTRHEEDRCLLVWKWGKNVFQSDQVDPRMVYLMRDDYWVSTIYDDRQCDTAIARIVRSVRSARTEPSGQLLPTQSPLCDWCEWRFRCPIHIESSI